MRNIPKWSVAAALALVVLIGFSGTVRNGFTGYDDGEYVTDNAHVKTGLNRENLKWAFTAAHSSNWHPLTWISHAADCQWFGLASADHHFVSLLLHALNAALLFLWLEGLTGMRGRSAFVALAFGLHPLHVESVAWVAERKDVLSTLFWMLTLLAYTSYARKPSAGRYALAALCFTAGLLSKPMVVTLPFVLLLIDFWPLGRNRHVAVRRLIVEKLPLVLLAAGASAATLWAHRQTGSVIAIEDLPLGWRLSNAAAAYIGYLWKAIWPVHLAVFYPMSPGGPPLWAAAASVAALAAATWIVLAMRKDRPWLAFGWLWYLLTLLPVIGIVQTGMQAMADRYTYLPMTGLLIAAAWQFGGAGKPFAFAAAAALALWTVLSWRQIGVWKDGVALFTHAIEVTDDNFVAHDNLGVELDRLGRSEEALREYRETLRIRPGDPHGENNFAQAVFAKGERLFLQGRLDEALPLFREGLNHRPRNAEARTYAGLILLEQARLPEAAAEFRRAIADQPAFARAYIGLGVTFARTGDVESAAREFQRALRYEPGNAEAAYDLKLLRGAIPK